LFCGQGFIIFLNIFVVFIPFVQFFVLRRPAHGDQSIAERVAEAAASRLGIHTPLGLRASKAAFERRNSSARFPQPADRKLIISFVPGGIPRTPVLAPSIVSNSNGAPPISAFRQNSDDGPDKAAEAAAAGLFNASKRQLQLQRVREANAKSYLMKRSRSGSNPRGSFSLTQSHSVRDDSGAGRRQGMHAAVAAANAVVLAEGDGSTTSEQHSSQESQDDSFFGSPFGLTAGLGFPYSPWDYGGQEYGKLGHDSEMDGMSRSSLAVNSMLLVDQLGLNFSKQPVDILEFAL
jgi:hypothetical protein